MALKPIAYVQAAWHTEIPITAGRRSWLKSRSTDTGRPTFGSSRCRAASRSR